MRRRLIPLRGRDETILSRDRSSSPYLSCHNALHYESDMGKLEWCADNELPVSVAEYDKRHRAKKAVTPYHCPICRRETPIWCGQCGSCMSCCQCED